MPDDRPASRYSFQKILTGFDFSSRRLPQMAVTAAEPGPLLWLTACVHGDEVGGIAVIQEVFERLRKGALRRGSVRAFPVLNPLGFEAMTRNVAPSHEDLNRAFPGDPEGTLAERIAHLVHEQIAASEPALVVDLHNDWIRSIPYAVLDAATAGADLDERVLRYAREAGFIAVRETAAHTQTGGLDRSLSASLLRRGIPAFTLELGEAFVVNERLVEHGVGAIWNLLQELALVDDTPERFRFGPTAVIPDRILTYHEGPRSARSGLIRFRVAPGDVVERGAVVARTYNVFGQLRETLRADVDGVVLGYSDYSMTYPGKTVLAFADLREPPRAPA